MDEFKIDQSGIGYIYLPVCARPGCSLFGVIQAPSDIIKSSNIYKDRRDEYFKK